MLGRTARILCTALCVSLWSASAHAAPPTEAAGHKFFEDRIRPLLVQSCYSCHGPTKQKGGLRLDSRAAVLKGGDAGPAVVPGNPKDGLLLEAVEYASDIKMPPQQKLTARQISDLTAWIQMGAPWPGQAGTVPTPATASTAEQPVSKGDHWAFQPIRDVAPPATKNTAWAKNPIDQFVLSKLEAQGLKPAVATDKRTLIRRAYFDLLGLPPAPQDVAAFLADSSPDAFAKVIDRLLASRHYGERWARHWLDVARYADSNGMDENLSHANAWKYRDWVINAFNADMPYDEFIRLQLAGDLLKPDSPEGVVPTGFLVFGPKMLAEDDPVKMHMDIIDEQLDTLGQAFLGLTLGCARCHDHKFDPIPTRDYYALGGIFKSTKTMDSFTVVAQWHERPLASPVEVAKQKAHDDRIAAVRKEIAALEKLKKEEALAEARRRVSEYITAAEEVRQGRNIVGVSLMARATPPARAIVIEAEAFQNGNVQPDRVQYGKGIGVILNGGPLPNFAEYSLAIPEEGLYQLELRFAAQEIRSVRVTIDGKPAGRAANQATGSWFADKQAWEPGPVFPLKSGKVTVRLERAGPFPHIDKLALVPVPPGHPVPVRVPTLAELRDLVPTFLDQWVAYLDRKGKAPVGEALQTAIADKDGPFHVPTPLDPVLSEQSLAALSGPRQRLAGLEKSRPTLPTAMAVSEGKPGNVRVHIRGSHLTLGAEVPRGFPTVLALPQQPELDSSSSGRRQLAEWLTRPDHPLTARVAANRIWTWHFGDGLVRTPDNFGRLGDKPVHGELLDWLATRFVRDGWSVKKLHRLIMTSATYQMSTTYDAASDRQDPENRWLWRRDRQRLDAETFRDALLTLAGALDRTPTGTLLKVPNRKYVTSTTNRSYDAYNSNRRSIYLPVVRSATYEPFQSFDFPDPSVPKGRRAVTTIPAQSLVLMNSQLVAQQTQRLAALLLKESGDDASRIRRAWELVYARPATTVEVERAGEFLKKYDQVALEEKLPQAEARQHAWQGLCRSLVSSNEFVYVE